MEDDPKPNHDALTSRVTSGGMYVCKLHYAADGHKNPQNKKGREWLRMALGGYAGGLEDPNWLKEMEIMYTAGAGGRVFPNWHEWRRSSSIFISHDVEIEGCQVHASYDHGYANPACYLVHTIDPSGLRRTIWEFYASEVPVPIIARIIKGEDVTTEDGRCFQGNPYAGKETVKVCDPEIDRATQVMAKGPNKSIKSLFARDGVFFTKGSSGDDLTVAGWLSGNLWLNPDDPKYQIHTRCKNLMWEFSKLQRKSMSVMDSRFKNLPEGLVDKDNHAWDAVKYWLKRFPVGSTSTEKPKPIADFAFWRDKAKSGVKLSYSRDFAK